MQGTSPLIHYYVAASTDNHIATADGGVAWLDPFNTIDYGFNSFMSTKGRV